MPQLVCPQLVLSLSSACPQLVLSLPSLAKNSKSSLWQSYIYILAHTHTHTCTHTPITRSPSLTCLQQFRPSLSPLPPPSLPLQSINPALLCNTHSQYTHSIYIIVGWALIIIYPHGCIHSLHTSSSNLPWELLYAMILYPLPL